MIRSLRQRRGGRFRAATFKHEQVGRPNEPTSSVFHALQLHQLLHQDKLYGSTVGLPLVLCSGVTPPLQNHVAPLSVPLHIDMGAYKPTGDDDTPSPYMGEGYSTIWGSSFNEGYVVPIQ